MKLYSDNKTDINITHNLVQHDRAKHFEVDKHSTLERVAANIPTIPFVGIADQLVDGITKNDGFYEHYDIIGKLGMIDIYASLQGEYCDVQEMMHVCYCYTLEGVYLLTSLMYKQG